MIHFHLLLARKHGTPDSYPIRAGNESAYPAILAKFNEIQSDTPEGRAFRAAHAEVALGHFVSDPGCTMEFPDPGEIAKRERSDAKKEAERIAAEQQSATAALSAAKQRAAAARDAAKSLTPEQRAHLAAQKPPAGTQKADSSAIALAEAEAKKRQARIARDLAESEAAAMSSTAALSSEADED